MVGLAVAVINQLLLKKKDFLSFAGEVAFIASFSCFINLFTRIAVGFFGIAILGVSISFYQRANLIMHPNDSTTNILRFLYLKK